MKDQDLTPSRRGLPPALILSIPLSRLAPARLAPAGLSTGTPGFLLRAFTMLVTLPGFFSLLTLHRAASSPPFHLFHSQVSVLGPGEAPHSREVLQVLTMCHLLGEAFLDHPEQGLSLWPLPWSLDTGVLHVGPGAPMGLVPCCTPSARKKAGTQKPLRRDWLGTPHSPLRCSLCPEHWMSVSPSFLGQPWESQVAHPWLPPEGAEPGFPLGLPAPESVLSAVVSGPGNTRGRWRS